MHARSSLSTALFAVAVSALVISASTSPLERRFVPCESLYNAHSSGTTMSESDVRDWIRYACYVFFPAGIGAQGTAAMKQGSVSDQTFLAMSGSTGGTTLSTHDMCGSDSQCATGYKCYKCPAYEWNCGLNSKAACGVSGVATAGIVDSEASTQAASAAAPQAAVVSVSSSSKGTTFDGSLTWYAGDTTTSCFGSNTLKDSELAVAISHEQSPQSWCGKQLCLRYEKTGQAVKFVTVTAKDTCPDSQCVDGHLDGTLGVWAALGIDLDVGKINKGQGFTWSEGAC